MHSVSDAPRDRRASLARRRGVRRVRKTYKYVLSDDGVDVSLSGSGSAGDEEVSGSVDCSAAPEPPENPEETCEYEAPGDGVPELPEPPEPEPPEPPAPPTLTGVPGVDSFVL